MVNDEEDEMVKPEDGNEAEEDLERKTRIQKKNKG